MVYEKAVADNFRHSLAIRWQKKMNLGCDDGLSPLVRTNIMSTKGPVGIQGIGFAVHSLPTLSAAMNVLLKW